MPFQDRLDAVTAAAEDLKQADLAIRKKQNEIADRNRELGRLQQRRTAVLTRLRRSLRQLKDAAEP